MEQKVDAPGFYKVDEKFIVNKDNNSLKMYKAQKAKIAQLNNLENDVNQLKSDLSEIKEMLKGLVK